MYRDGVEGGASKTSLILSTENFVSISPNRVIQEGIFKNEK